PHSATTETCSPPTTSHSQPDSAPQTTHSALKTAQGTTLERKSSDLASCWERWGFVPERQPNFLMVANPQAESPPRRFQKRYEVGEFLARELLVQALGHD